MSKVNLYVVLSPGMSADKVVIEPHVVKLDWMFAEKTEKDLIDLIAEVDKQQKVLEKWKEAAKGVLKPRLSEPVDPGSETITYGKAYEAHYSKSIRTDIDRDMVKADMGQDWYLKHCKVSEVLMLKIVPITQTPGVVKEEV